MGSNSSVFNRKVDCPHSFRAARRAAGGTTIPALCPDNPVESVSYDNIQEFISRLNHRQSQCTYRLPREEEWEYAARAGTTTAFSFGSEPIDRYTVTSASGIQQRTAPVAGRHDNPWHLYDMHGNVWEWTADVYRAYPTSPATLPPDDPSSRSPRVIRGGSWGNNARIVRSAQRNYDPPGYRDSNVGFRFVRTCP